jgi:hypothetical protein
MSDIRLQTNFRSNAKIRRLHLRSGSEGVLALLTLWAWAGEHRPDGKLSDLTEEEIENFAEWRGESGTLIASLTELKFLDRVKVRVYEIHDWSDWQPWISGSKERSAKARAAAKVRWGV